MKDQRVSDIYDNAMAHACDTVAKVQQFNTAECTILALKARHDVDKI